MNMTKKVKKMSNPRALAVAGILGAMSIVLGMTPLGFVPLPTAAGHATTMHIPVILAGILEGPIIGGLVGLIFGLHSFIQAGSPIFADPFVAVIPRILIGVVSYLAYKFTKSEWIAATLGTITNTTGVLGLAVIRGYLPVPVAWTIAVIHGFPEIIVAILLTTAVYKALKRAKLY